MLSLLQFDGFILLAIAAIMLFSGLVHGTLGLGFPMVATPLLATMMDVRSAILITLLPTMAVNIASIATSPSFGEAGRQYWPLILASLVGSVAGTAFLAISDPTIFRALLAALILIYLWDGLRLPRPWMERQAMIAMIGFGLVAGFSAGTTNVMVAVLIIYFLSMETPRSIMVPALNACFLVGKAMQILVLALAGMVSLMLALQTLPLALAAVAALMFGRKIQSRIDVAGYQRLLRGLLALLALILILQFVREVGWLNGISA